MTDVFGYFIRKHLFFSVKYATMDIAYRTVLYTSYFVSVLNRVNSK